MRFVLPDTAAARAALKDEFLETGRCSIAPILSNEDALALETFLAEFEDWNRMRGFQSRRFDMPPRRTWQDNPAAVAESDQIERAIATDSGKAFAYRYDAISMVPDLLAALGETPLAALRQAFTDEATLAFIRDLSEENSVREVEIQATRFHEGDFLSQHHDGPTHDRKVATVLGLSRDWIADWGGNLLFPSVDERIEGLSPGFNRLDLFGVPQFHLVTAVAASAPRPRMAVSGWFVS